MALKLDILANTSQLVKEMRDAGKSVDEISDALDDMVREASDAERETVRSLKDIAKQSDKTERAVKDVGGKGFTDAKEASGEFKDEALANFSEVTSSFDGSMSSVADLAQGTLGGIASSIPGVGIAAGVAAAGVGLIGAELTRVEERTAEVKQSIIDDFLELGDALDKEAVDARVRDILGTKELSDQAKLLADLLDITVGEAALAMAGDFESAGVTVDETMKGINDAGGNVDLKVLQDLTTTINATEEGMKAGKEAAEAQAEAQRKTAQTTAEAQADQRTAVEQTRIKLQELLDMPQGTTMTVKVNVDDSSVTAFEDRVRQGLILPVGVTALNGGRTWE